MKEVRANEGSKHTFYTSNPSNQFEERKDYVDQSKSILEKVREKFKRDMSIGMSIQDAKGKVLYKNFRTPNSQAGAESHRAFQHFKKANDFISFDIETMGDTNSNLYSITEVSFDRFNKQSQKLQGGFTKLVKPSDGTIKSLNDLLNQFSTDPLSINRMTDTERRSLVDTMRYSKIVAPGVQSFTATGDIVSHNTLVEDYLTKEGKINYSILLDNPEEYTKHMVSGIKTLNEVSYTQDNLAKDMNNYFEKNKKNLFLSYNGRNFDLKVMNQFLQEKVGTPLKVEKHLDLYQLLKTYDLDKDVLEKSLGSKVKSLTLQDLVKGFEDEGSKHSASADVEVLANLMNRLEEDLVEKEEEITRNKKIKGNILSKHDISEEKVKIGDQFKAKKAYRAFDWGDMVDESFMTIRDPETGKVDVHPYGNNKYATESAGTYSYEGIIDISEGNEQKLALRMKNLNNGNETFLVRKGLNAESDLEGILHSYFKPSNLTKEQIAKDAEKVEKDRARRAYDRLFDIDGAGQGVYIKDSQLIESSSSGFIGAEKYFQIAQEEKKIISRNMDELEERLKEEVGGKTKKEKKANAWNRRNQLMASYREKVDEEVNRMLDERFKKENDKERYRKLSGRLRDEADIYTPVLKEIREQFDSKLREASVRQEASAVREVAQKRDEALFRVHRKIQEKVEDMGGNKTEISVQGIHRRVFDFTNYKGEEKSLNISDFETARGSILSQIRQDVKKGEGYDERRRNSLIRFVENLDQQGLISKEQRKELIQDIFDSNSVYTSAGNVAGVFFGEKAIEGTKYDSRREVESINSNKVIGRVMTPQEAVEISKEEIAKANSQKPQFKMKNKKLVLEETNELIKLIGGRYEKVDGKLQGRGNIEAIEEVMRALSGKRSDGSITGLAVDVVDSPSGLQANVYAYDQSDHNSVFKSLEKGSEPSRAFKVSIPLINEDGVQKHGGLVVNSHKIASYRNGVPELFTTSHAFAKEMSFTIKEQYENFLSGEEHEADTFIRRKATQIFQRQAGVNRGVSQYNANDTRTYKGNTSDYIKQNEIFVEDAMIRHLSEEGYKGLKINEGDFKESAYYVDDKGERKLKSRLSFRDIHEYKHMDIKMAQFDWFNDVFSEFGHVAMSSGVKSDKIGEFVGTVDGRDAIIFGAYSDSKRDNMVQWGNAFKFEQDDIKALEKINGISFKQSIMTPVDLRMDPGVRSDSRMNANIAIMDDQMIAKRVEKMMDTEEGRGILSRSNILNSDGTINWEHVPRTYEQQVAVSEDVYKHMNITREQTHVADKQFSLADNIRTGSVVKPGEVIAYEEGLDGKKRAIINERTNDATIGTISDDLKTLSVTWKERAHKVMPSGDKGTLLSYSQELIDAITGHENISFIHNPDVAKHKDFNLLFSGEVQKLTEATQRSRGEKKQRMIQAIEEAQLGIEWSPEQNRFIDLTNRGRGLAEGEEFKEIVGRMDKLFENKDFKGLKREAVFNYEDGSSQTIHTYRNQITMSGVYRYTQTYGDEGNLYLGHDIDPETGRPKSLIFSNERGGVSFGHREMRTFSNLGAENFYNYLVGTMKEQDRESGVIKNISNSDYIKNMITSIDKFNEGPQSGEVVLRYSDFKSLPKDGRTEMDYKGTIFDTSYLASKSGDKTGVWMSLPTYSEGDFTIKPEVNVDGEIKQIDKIFIPSVQSNYTKGERFSDELQGIIQSIYRRAEEADSSETPEERVKNIKRIGSLVEQYREQATFELTSSKGLVGKLTKATVPNSMSNAVAKMIDGDRSEKIKAARGITGEFTMISEKQAIGMGIYDQLKSGEEVYGVVTRYPTINDKSTVFSRVIMSDLLDENDIHVTERLGILLNSDNDGDQLMLVTPKNQSIQAEFKELSHLNPERFSEELAKEQKHKDAIYKYLAGETGETVDTIQSVIQNEDFKVLQKNSADELAAKIGKSVIGKASNFNYSLQQVAGMYYASSSKEHAIVQNFGSAVEQRVISSKHGASTAASEFVSALNSNNWSKAIQIDKEHYGGMFVEDYDMDKVRHLMESKIREVNPEKGLYDDMFSFGKGSGVFTTPEKALEIMKGSTYNPVNQMLNLSREILRVGEVDVGSKPGNLLKQDSKVEFQDKSNEEKLRKLEAERLSIQEERKIRDTKLQTGFEENIQPGSDTINTRAERLRSTSRANLGMLAAGATAGAVGATILNSSTPTKEDFENYTSNKSVEDRRKELRDKDFVGSGYLGVSNQNEIRNTNFDYNISGTVRSTSDGRMPTNVARSLGVSSTPSMSINDNVSRLSTNWYRDRVAENM